MKKLLTSAGILFTLLLTAVMAVAQNAFEWQNPKPYGNKLYATRFVNNTTGWNVGSNGTVMKSTDGGKTWVLQKSNTTASLNSVFFIDANTGWAAGGNTLIKTTDGGTTWNVLTTSAPTALTYIYFFNATTGIISGFGQIFKTTDGGTTLNQVAGGTLVNFSNMFHVYFCNASYGWSVGTNGRILKTTDGGNTWTAQVSNTTNRLNSIYFSDTLNGSAYGDYGIRITTSNGGATWTLPTSVINNHINSTYFVTPLKAWAVTESNSDSTTIYKTTNGGATWSSYWAGTDRALTGVSFTDSLHGWVAGHGGIMLWTTDGGLNWTPSSSGITTPLISSFFLTPGIGWAVGEQGGTLRTTNGGTTWTSGKIPGASYLNGVCFTTKDTGFVAAGFGNNQIYKTYDAGLTWKPMVTPRNDYFLNSVFFCNRFTGWSVGFNGKIIRSTNGGENWAEQSSTTTNDLYSVYFFKADTVKNPGTYNDSIGFAVGSKGTILKTTSGGNSWVTQTSSVTATLNSVFFLDSIHGWCVGGGGTILRTNNGGVLWEKQTSGITNSIYGIQFINLNVGFAVGDYGKVLKTTNGGVTWTPLTTGTDNRLYTLSFVDANTGYVMGTYGTVLKTTNGGGSFVSETRTNSTDVIVYPNPARSKITIVLPNTAMKNGVVKVFDLSGQLMTEQTFQNQQQVEMPVYGLAAGTYIIKIQSSEGTACKKLVIE